MDFKEAMMHRRSQYSIEKKSPISDEKIFELVEFAMKHSPAAFNTPSQTTAVLLGEKHNQLWDIVLNTLQGIVPANQFSATETKIRSFQAGYGTILYFSDAEVSQSLQEKFPLYKDNVPVYAQQANGMLQVAIWNLLELEGFGASLQHYNPLIDEAVQTAFDIPKSWQLIAQMPFGLPTAQPAPKKFAPIEARIKLIK